MFRGKPASNGRVKGHDASFSAVAAHIEQDDHVGAKRSIFAARKIFRNGRNLAVLIPGGVAWR